MDHSFDKEYWEQHWREAPDAASGHGAQPSPYVVDAARALRPGTALDAGCGTGADAIWLAAQGWRVTGADISAHALEVAAENSRRASVADRTTWIAADLTAWDPSDRWDLVATSYAHPAMPQLAFYQRIAEWVAPGGTLLIVGHRHESFEGTHEHESGPPEKATATLSDIRAGLDPNAWRIEVAEERSRPMPAESGHPALNDVVVSATRVGVTRNSARPLENWAEWFRRV